MAGELMGDSSAEDRDTAPMPGAPALAVLMPLPSYRWCACCDRRWFTATPAAQLCPFCGAEAKDASIGWPHSCAREHIAQHGGACIECEHARIAKGVERMKEVTPWVDRVPRESEGAT